MVWLNRFRAFHLLHPADQCLRSTDQGHGRHAMLHVQEQDLLQTSNGVGVIVSRQMLFLMHDKNFTKASQAAAFLGLIPIKSLNPFQSGIFTQCVISICAVRYTGIEMLVLDMK